MPPHSSQSTAITIAPLRTVRARRGALVWGTSFPRGDGSWPAGGVGVGGVGGGAGLGLGVVAPPLSGAGGGGGVGWGGGGVG